MSLRADPVSRSNGCSRPVRHPGAPTHHQPWPGLVAALGPALALALAVFPLAPAASAAMLRVGVFGQDPPKSFVADGGVLVGFDIDVAEALCRELRVRCRLEQTDWSSLLPRLGEGQLDFVVASMTATDERRALADFTGPYYSSPARFVARRGRIAEVNPKTVARLRIGVRRGTTFDTYVTEILGASAKVDRYATQLDALLDLLLGRTDLVFSDEMALRQAFLATSLGADFEFVGDPVTDARWFGDGNAVAVRRGERTLLELLDRALAEMRERGEIEHLRRRWFGPATGPEPAELTGAGR